MKSVNLTPKQKKIFDFITSFYDKEGYAPSLAEIANKFKKSTTTIFQFVETLKEKGFLNKEGNTWRGISPSASKSKIFLLGYIAAGEPIEAISNPEPITVPKVMLSKSGLHYALKVKGNSMVDEGIYDGNTVIIRRQETATNGQKVVALINGNEATLKKIYKEKNGFRLQPANSSMKPIIVKDLIIQGKFMGVLPNYEDRSKSITEVVQTPTQRQFELDRIITGDVLEVMAQIPDNSIHLAITSPPYNVGKNYDNHNDRMDYQQYLDWLETVWRETKRVLVPGGRFALNIAPTGIKNFVPIHHDFTNQMRKIGMKFRAEILWYKQTMLKRTAWGSFKSPSNPHIVPSWEYVLVFTKEKDRLDGNPKNADINKEEFMNFSDGFWKIQPETRRNGHPAPFPEELIYRLIKFYSYKGNTILDMFGGTGTVAVVANKTKRHFIHIDISEEYNKVAQMRLDKFVTNGKN
ncbi:MAG: methylase N-4/N-6 protein [Microgenomates group bacterium GW2011_GWC1_38_12]|nr:MAG: methylase N-4/N-6 protein [Microgenomates group bacterium GW2011_GWC1_38_12]